MKNQKINSIMKCTYHVMWVCIVLATVSCSDQKSYSQDKNSTSTAAVEAPKIDIHSAVLQSNTEALKQHIAAGSNLNEKDPFGGSSPLISAAVFGKTEMAKLLIDAGADIQSQNNEGSTALHSAAFFCRPEIVQMLLAKGANKIVKNKYNSTAYESVVGPFAEVKPAYVMMVQMLAPMGLALDYSYIEKTRPEIAAMLK